MFKTNSRTYSRTAAVGKQGEIFFGVFLLFFKRLQAVQVVSSRCKVSTR